MKHMVPSPFHLDISTGVLAQVLEQIASFEVLVGVDNCLQLCGAHDVFILGLLDFGLVKVLENPVSCQS